jgi:hypothetical protein
MGGTYYGMCLFNPQIDIHTFLKHYRESFPVLTSPLTLHFYHGNGFPYMLAFKDGGQIVKSGLSPYEDNFQMITKKLWPDSPQTVRLTSPNHMANYFVYSNKINAGVVVYPDDDPEFFKERTERFKEIEGITIRYESQFTEDDAAKNIHFHQKQTGKLTLNYLTGKDIPIQVDAKTIQFGDFVFPRDEVGVVTHFPNPGNPDRYILLTLKGSKLQGEIRENFVDYLVYRDGEDGEAEVLLHGFFDKSDKNWKFSNRLSFRSKSAEAFCRDGICPAPGDPAVAGGRLTGMQEDLTEQTSDAPLIQATHQNNVWSFGGGGSRFPDVLADLQNVCWVAWEEMGNIYLSSILGAREPEIIPMEAGPSDSFHPVLAMDLDKIWVFYLNDADGFYRVYGRSIQDLVPSDPILISEEQPCDAITPAAAWDEEGKITIAWSDWKANSRYPKYRTLDDRFLGDILPIHIKIPEIDYTNAWCPSLVCDKDGKVHGTWNQHYPLSLGVYAGDLITEASEVSEKEGGYPSVAIDNDNKMWVVWETSLWNARQGQTQMIQASYYDAERGQWAIPYTVSKNDMGFFNQTPKAAVAPDGRIWVAWSGRKDTSNPWCVYVSHLENESWSDPQMVSTDKETARAPSISIAPNGGVWTAWHSGTGADMKIHVVWNDGR